MRTLIVLAVVTSGCGFEREAPYAGVRVPDVAPWQDLGPLTVCTADARRLAAPSLGTAGLCLSRPSTGDGACSADADCKSRERCLCGACTVAVCDSADECAGGFVCTFADRRCDRACDTDDQCAAGERCVPGRHVCRGACATTADCQRGESCQTSTGLCVTTACAADDECGGRACALQRQAALLAEPSPLVGPDGVDLWLERTDADGIARIWHGRGDGTRFTLDAAAQLDGAAPSVARLPDGSYALVFARGANLYAARSPDGLVWSAPTDALPGAAQPSLVVLPDGTPLLYAVDPQGAITRFVGTDALVFDRPTVMLTPDAVRTPLWPDVDVLASPFADGDRLWFTAHGTESAPSSQFGMPVPSPPDYSIAVAVADGSGGFVPSASDPVFDRTTDFINHPSELDPAVARLGAPDDHRWLLYYRRAKPDGSAGETLAVAVSPAAPR